MTTMVVIVAVVLLVILFGGPSAVIDSVESMMRKAVDWAAVTLRALVG